MPETAKPLAYGDHPFFGQWPEQTVVGHIQRRYDKHRVLAEVTHPVTRHDIGLYILEIQRFMHKVNRIIGIDRITASVMIRHKRERMMHKSGYCNEHSAVRSVPAPGPLRDACGFYPGAHDYRETMLIIGYYTLFDSCHPHYFIKQLLRRICSDVIKLALAVTVFGNDRPLSEKRMIAVGKRFGSLRQYSMLVIPPLYVADDSLLMSIDKFVKDGGYVVMMHKSGYCNEHSAVRSVPAPGPLRDSHGTISVSIFWKYNALCTRSTG